MQPNQFKAVRQKSRPDGHSRVGRVDADTRPDFDIDGL